MNFLLPSSVQPAKFFFGQGVKCLQNIKIYIGKVTIAFYDKSNVFEATVRKRKRTRTSRSFKVSN